MTPLKPGDLLYVVDENWEGTKLEVHTAKVVSVGMKSVRITGPKGGGTGLAFHCRSRLTRPEAERFPRSEKDAYLHYIYQAEDSIKEREAQIRELHELARQARTTMRARGWLDD